MQSSRVRERWENSSAARFGLRVAVMWDAVTITKRKPKARKYAKTERYFPQIRVLHNKILFSFFLLASAAAAPAAAVWFVSMVVFGKDLL